MPDLAASHFLTVGPSPRDPRSLVLTLRFFQDEKQVDSRGRCTPAHFSIEFHNEVMVRFLEEIQKNPDLLEDFYQKVFADLDARDSHLGMRRLKASGFFLIIPRKMQEAGRVEEWDTETLEKFFSKVKRYHYQRGPYGTGEKFRVR
jgi:hypothetical protein